jgi:GTPase SAR1 family protein
MNKKVKKIVILGDKGTEKSSLFNLLFKKYKKADDHFSLRTYPLINYSERDISISGNNYKIFDTPFFDFANRKEKIRNLVAYESKRIIEELVESCDLVI